MHTGTEKQDVSLAKEFKDHMEKYHRKKFAIDQGKFKKQFTERKCTEIKYHVQDNAALNSNM